MLIGKSLDRFRFIWIFSQYFLKLFHTVLVDRFIACDTLEMKELCFPSTRFFSVSILVRGGPESLERQKSPEAINLSITLEKA